MLLDEEQAAVERAIEVLERGQAQGGVMTLPTRDEIKQAIYAKYEYEETGTKLWEAEVADYVLALIDQATKELCDEIERLRAHLAMTKSGALCVELVLKKERDAALAECERLRTTVETITDDADMRIIKLRAERDAWRACADQLYAAWFDLTMPEALAAYEKLKGADS